jgi:Holliday junction resolvase RusA-like endonuclease
MGGQEPLAGPLSVTVTAWVRMPASIPRRDRMTARPVKRPDLDNYVKLAFDGCSPLWGDDSQVVELRAAKRYAVGSSPRWELAVEQLDPMNGGQRW